MFRVKKDINALIPEIGLEIQGAKSIALKKLAQNLIPFSKHKKWSLADGITATLIPMHKSTGGAAYFTLNSDPEKHPLPAIHKLLTSCIELETLQLRSNKPASNEASKVAADYYIELIRKIAATQNLPTPEADIQRIAPLLRNVASDTAQWLIDKDALKQCVRMVDGNKAIKHAFPYTTPIGTFPADIFIKNPRLLSHQAEADALNPKLARGR